MSETTPLNEWPVDKLYHLRDAVEDTILKEDLEYAKTKYLILSIIKTAIRDAEEKLNELPFK